MNWRKVFNAIVIPTLTYGVPVWYTGKRQKGLINRMQIAQNEGLRKMTGVFRTTPVEPLHNLTRVPPISYVLDKLILSYSQRLEGLPPQCKTRTIITADQCRYWPAYVQPPTNLARVSQNLGPPTYHPNDLDLCTASSIWSHSRLHYLPKPPPHITVRYKESWERQEVSDTHITVSHTILQGQHVATYRIIRNKNRITYGIYKGADRTQAICLAVKHALSHPHTQPLFTHYTILWLPSPICETLTASSPHRHSPITREISTLVSNYLQNELHTFHLRSTGPSWPGKPSTDELRSLDPELEAVASLPLHPSLLTPSQAMWQTIHQDYRPNPHPAYIACTPPHNPIPPPAIRAAAASRNRLASATIFRWATGHSFDAAYSLRFRPNADDIITCPCADIPRPNPTHPQRPRYQHTKEHVLFHCVRYTQQRRLILGNHTSLRVIFRSHGKPHPFRPGNKHLAPPSAPPPSPQGTPAQSPIS
jgi:hypothetical protein